MRVVKIYCPPNTDVSKAINFGGTVYKWDSGPEITFWVLAGVLFVAFGISQFYHPFVSSQHKLYPTHFLKRPVLVILQIMIFCASGCTFVGHPLSQQLFDQSLIIKQTPTYYIPLFFQFALVRR